MRWLEQNGRDGWELEFLDDEDADKWVWDKFNGSDVAWAWEYMRGQAPWVGMEMLRYLLLLTRGGVYSDVDVSDSAVVCAYSTGLMYCRPAPSDLSSSGVSDASRSSI